MKSIVKFPMLPTDTDASVIQHVAMNCWLPQIDERPDSLIEEEMQSLGYSKDEFKIVIVKFEIQDSKEPALDYKQMHDELLEKYKELASELDCWIKADSDNTENRG